MSRERLLPARLAGPAAWLTASPERLLYGFGALVVAGTGLMAATKQVGYVMPAAGLVFLGFLMLADVQPVLLTLLAVLPFSKNVELPGGTSLDLPSEPLMLLLLSLVMLKALRGQLGEVRWLQHPITYLMLLQLAWAGWTTFFSVDQLHSLKYVLAKVWYLASFVVATGLVVRRPEDVRLIIWAFLPPLLFTVVWAVLRHLTRGLAFSQIGWAIQPFYLNHVIYAITVAQLLPYAWLGPAITDRGHTGFGRRGWQAAILIILTGIVLAYTRATWLAVIAALGYYVMLRLRLVRVVLSVIIIVVGLAIAWLVEDQRYLRYQPDYAHTIWNGNDLSKHLTSTVELSDVSGMERVYRWVAAARMIAYRPWYGSGPSTFYPEYRKFTDKRFRTYVSDNPERSTTHNYFLLQLAEQGIPGLVLFGLVVWWGLTVPQDLYHRTRDPRLRAIVLAAGLSLVIIVFHLTLNEVVEVDKIGSFFFINLTLLMRADGWNREVTKTPLIN